jgi:hypothetical protein
MSNMYPKSIKRPHQTANIAKFIERVAHRLSGALTAALHATRSRLIGLATFSRKVTGLSIYGPSKLLAAFRMSRPNRFGQTAKTNTRAIGATFPVIALSGCFGLIGLLGILVIVLISQVQNVKRDIAKYQNELAAIRARETKMENYIAESSVRPASTTPKADRTQPPLLLDEADSKIVRQFIKVIPLRAGTSEKKIQVGDAVLTLSSAFIPDGLVQQLPKLRGAKFLIDQDGTIVIIAQGSSHADILIPAR